MIVAIFLLTIIPSFLAQDIVFPEGVTELVVMNISEKVISPSCPTNMIYDAEEDDCECKTGTLYHVGTDRCYVPFRKGPCSAGEHFILPKELDMAECVVNRCGNNGTIPYGNTCIQLLKLGPPCAAGETVVVDEDTHELMCQRITPVVYQIITAPVRGCARGTRKIASGKCRAIL